MIRRTHWLGIFFMAWVACPTFFFAQGANDALRFSSFSPEGSARAIGVHGTMGALGADFSVAAVNPAGLAWYRKGEITFTPGFLLANTRSTLLSGQGNREVSENKGNFHFGNIGMVFTSDPRGPDWRALNFALGINRIQNFNRRLYFEGDSRGSIIDRFQEIANSPTGLDQLEAGPAFDAGAIYDFNNDGFYDSDVELAPNAIIRRKQTINTSGAMQELVMAFGANYKDVLMVGASIGLPTVRYSETKNYDEEDLDNAIPFFDNLQYEENLRITGLGVNAKAGIVVRPAQMFRVGAAVHTPTRFRLEDSYSSQITYNYTESGQARTGTGRSPDGNFRYTLATPWRFSGHAAVIAGKKGFVSAEAEYVHYGRARFRFRDFPQDEENANQRIADRLTTALNLRLGGEYAYKMFRFRAGAGISPTGVKEDVSSNVSLSAGAGIRAEKVFFDIAYRRTAAEQTYRPYLTAQAPEQVVSSRSARNLAVMTLGFRF